MSLTHAEVNNTFESLVQDLSRVLGPSSGLDSADVDLDALMRLMGEYVSNSDDWRKYALGDPSRGYTRNLVDSGNGKSNLLILVWTPGKGSPIHDHAQAHCIMKILSGTLRETLYDWPDPITLESGTPSPPKVTRESLYHENEVTYISDKYGVHRVMNPDPEKMAVSLHLYTPPHAAIQGCHMFDGKSGKASHVPPVQYFSEYGQQVSKSSI